MIDTDGGASMCAAEAAHVRCGSGPCSTGGGRLASSIDVGSSPMADAITVEARAKKVDDSPER